MPGNLIKGLIVSVFFLGTTNAIAEEYMTEDQIRAALSGKTCDIEKINPRKEKTKYFSIYYAEDGSRTLNLPWKNNPIQVRKWWTDGNLICGSHPKMDDSCRKMKNMGDGVYHLFPVQGRNKGLHKRTFSNCRDGKHLDS